MKTVVHILPYMAKGGTEKHVLTLMRGLRTKYNLILLAPKGEILEEFLNLGIEYKEFPEIKRNVFNKVKAFENALLELSKKYTIDILHIHAAHEFLIFSKKVLPETPIIFHLSAYQGSSISKWINYKLAALICRKKADYVVAVSDEEIIDAIYELASKTGVFAEPAAAASFAGLKKYKEMHKLDKNDRVVVIITGSGLKAVTGIPTHWHKPAG